MSDNYNLQKELEKIVNFKSGPYSVIVSENKDDCVMILSFINSYSKYQKQTDITIRYKDIKRTNECSITMNPINLDLPIDRIYMCFTKYLSYLNEYTIEMNIENKLNLNTPKAWFDVMRRFLYSKYAGNVDIFKEDRTIVHSHEYKGQKFHIEYKVLHSTMTINYLLPFDKVVGKWIENDVKYIKDLISEIQEIEYANNNKLVTDITVSEESFEEDMNGVYDEKKDFDNKTYIKPFKNMCYYILENNKLYVILDEDYNLGTMLAEILQEKHSLEYHERRKREGKNE